MRFESRLSTLLCRKFSLHPSTVIYILRNIRQQKTSKEKLCIIQEVSLNFTRLVEMQQLLASSFLKVYLNLGVASTDIFSQNSRYTVQTSQFHN